MWGPLAENFLATTPMFCNYATGYMEYYRYAKLDEKVSLRF